MLLCRKSMKYPLTDQKFVSIMICETVANLRWGEILPRYSTKQREALLNFLNAHGHELLTASQIADGLHALKVSISAVYRNLADLEREGKVRKHTQNGSRKTLYQYVVADCCRGRLHLCCTVCGQTVHLDDQLAQKMMRHFEQDAKFTVIPADTVIYGICSRCKKD